MSHVKCKNWSCYPSPFFPMLMSNQNNLMSHVNFKKWSMSLIFSPILLGFVSHVDFLENVWVALLHVWLKSLSLSQ